MRVPVQFLRGEHATSRRSGTVLLMLLLFQIAWVLLVRLQEPRLVDLEVGQPVPFTIASLGGSSDPKVATGTCRLVFACSRTCPNCSAFARRYSEQLRAGTAAQMRPLWFITADPADALRWAEEHNIPANEVRALLPLPQQFRPRFGRIWFSPMRVILDSDNLLVDARPSDMIPGPAELDRLCADGGIAPRSLEDLMARIVVR